MSRHCSVKKKDKRKRCGTSRKGQKPPWDPCCPKLNHLIICKDCGCTFSEIRGSSPDEKRLRLVDFCGCTGNNSLDILFSINVQAASQFCCQSSAKQPCDCQRCRRCRPLAHGDHYPDCECSLCERRTAKCPNTEYYKIKMLQECDEENEGDEDSPGFSRYCRPEKKGISCGCRERARMLHALHGAKCVCSKCMAFRLESRKCCEQFDRTNARRFPKKPVDESWNDNFCNYNNINFFPNIPQSCGHGPLCTCPSEYMASAAGITTYTRDETKPCLCHTFAPTHWERTAPCDFRINEPSRGMSIRDTSRELISLVSKNSKKSLDKYGNTTKGIKNSKSKDTLTSTTPSGSSKASKSTLLGIPDKPENSAKNGGTTPTKSASESNMRGPKATPQQYLKAAIKSSTPPSTAPSTKVPEEQQMLPRQAKSPKRNSQDSNQGSTLNLRALQPKKNSMDKSKSDDDAMSLL